MDFKSCIFCLVLFLPFLQFCACARIFCLFPYPGHSHQSVFRGYTQELAKHGHQLVIATPMPLNSNHPNITEIDLGFGLTIFNKHLDSIKMGDPNYLYNAVISIHSFISTYIKYMFTKPELSDIFHKKGEPFDLFVAEFLEEFSVALQAMLEIPMIGIVSMDTNFSGHRCIGNYHHVQSFTDVGFGDGTFPTSFLGRTKKIMNYILLLFMYFECAKNVLQMLHEIMDKKAVNSPCNVELLLVNSHPVLGNVLPVAPRYIDITGIHLQPLKPLPTELKTLIDQAKKGFILFSFGSSSKITSVDMKQTFLQAFAELPYLVIMKEKDTTGLTIPSNVKSFPWLPQQDILRHPKAKLFIFHGGYQSFVEGVSYGVPMIVTPFIMDQHYNANNVVNLGIGRQLDLNDLEVKKIKDDIIAVINSEVYKENVVRLGKQLFDSPQTPQEKAVWWTEYVLRNNGTKQLQSLQKPLTLIQLFHLDIIAAAFTVLILLSICIYYVSVRLIRFLIRSCSRKHDIRKKKL